MSLHPFRGSSFKYQCFIKVISSLVIAAVISVAIYGVMNAMVTQAPSDVIIKSMNFSNEQAEGNEIVFRGAIVDDRWYHATELCPKSSWIKEDEIVLRWKNYGLSAPISSEIFFTLSAGSERKLVFDSDKWKGKVKISIDENEFVFDCFSPKEDRTDIAFDIPSIKNTENIKSSVHIYISIGVFFILSACFISLSIYELKKMPLMKKEGGGIEKYGEIY